MNLRAKQARDVSLYSIQQFRKAIWSGEKPDGRLLTAQEAVQQVRRRLCLPWDSKEVQKLD